MKQVPKAEALPLETGLKASEAPMGFKWVPEEPLLHAPSIYPSSTSLPFLSPEAFLRAVVIPQRDEFFP